LVNAEFAVPPEDEESRQSGIGRFQAEPIVKVLFDDSDDTPAIGEVWGPEPGQPEVTKGPAPSGWGIKVLCIIQTGEQSPQKILAALAGFSGNFPVPYPPGGSCPWSNFNKEFGCAFNSGGDPCQWYFQWLGCITTYSSVDVFLFSYRLPSSYGDITLPAGINVVVQASIYGVAHASVYFVKNISPVQSPLPDCMGSSSIFQGDIPFFGNGTGQTGTPTCELSLS
jgi:hypothetical protein